MAFKFADAPISHAKSLALFARPGVDAGIENMEWVEHRPISQISYGAPIEFSIPGTGMEYIDLRQTRLHLKVRIKKKDGTPLTPDDKVSFVNSPLHSLWRQIDLTLQGRLPSPAINTNYPYKAMLDILLNFSEDSKESQLQSQLYFKDTAGYMDSADPLKGGNFGLTQRYDLTKNGDTIDLEGGLCLDVLQQDRLLLNGVPVTIKLFPSSDKFRLMAVDDNYMVNITDAILKVAKVKTSPSVIVGHDEAMKTHNAIYPMKYSDIKSYSISKDLLVWNCEDPFLGCVPSRLVVALVPSSAYSGSERRNPFNFCNTNVSFMGFYVDNHPKPAAPFTPNYKTRNYATEYLSLFQGTGKYGRDTGNYITREDYLEGYAIYVFQLDYKTDSGTVNSLKKGHTRLSIQFSEPVPETTTALLYATFPQTMQITRERNILFE